MSSSPVFAIANAQQITVELSVPAVTGTQVTRS